MGKDESDRNAFAQAMAAREVQGAASLAPRSSTAEKARALRLERLKTMLQNRLDHAPAALEALVAELRAGEAQPELWEALHSAAARDAKEPDLASAYRTVTADRRLQQLAPGAQAEVLMHAADFVQGVIGDAEGSELFLQRVLDVDPGHPVAFERLERRYEAARDKLRLAELYARVASKPPKPPEELVRLAVIAIVPLPAKSPLSDDAC